MMRKRKIAIGLCFMLLAGCTNIIKGEWWHSETPFNGIIYSEINDKGTMIVTELFTEEIDVGVCVDCLAEKKYLIGRTFDMREDINTSTNDSSYKVKNSEIVFYDLIEDSVDEDLTLDVSKLMKAVGCSGWMCGESEDLHSPNPGGMTVAGREYIRFWAHDPKKDLSDHTDDVEVYQEFKGSEIIKISDGTLVYSEQDVKWQNEMESILSKESLKSEGYIKLDTIAYQCPENGIGVFRCGGGTVGIQVPGYSPCLKSEKINEVFPNLKTYKVSDEDLVTFYLFDYPSKEDIEEILDGVSE